MAASHTEAALNGAALGVLAVSLSPRPLALVRLGAFDADSCGLDRSVACGAGAA